MAHKFIFSAVLFFGITLVLSVYAFADLTTYSRSDYTNQSNVNLSFLTVNQEGQAEIKLCDYSGGDIGGIIWGADCVADFFNVLFSFVGLGTAFIFSTVWSAWIFISIIVVFIYFVARLIRGGG